MKKVILLAALVFLAVNLPVFAASTEVVVAVPTLGDHLDPHRVPGNGANMLMHIFDNLTRLDTKGDVQPNIAESWTNIAPTIWRFKIKKGLKFHNGESLDAKVVKLNQERLNNPKMPGITSDLKGIVKTELIDDYTIDFYSKTADALFPNRMSYFLIAPASMLGDLTSTEFNKRPIGSGPYKFVEWVPDDRIVLVANPEYHRGAPSISKITFKVIPEKSSQIASLMTGAVDHVEGIPPDMITRIDASKNTRVVSRPSPVSSVVIMRTDVESPFKDRRVRQAVNYAVDMDTIIKTILSGKASRKSTPVSSVDVGYNPDVPLYPYDPAMAKKLLAEAGYPNGFSIKFEATPSVDGVYNMEVLQAVCQYLQKVGISADLVNVEYGIMRQKVYGDRTVAPIFRWSWKTWYGDPLGTLDGFFHWGSLGCFTNDPKLTKMIEDIAKEPNKTKRDQLIKDVQVIIHEEAYHLPLYALQTSYGVSERLAWEPRADERVYLYDASIK